MPTHLLCVAAAWPLPGLGLLALPAGPTPYLGLQALHTALPVVAIATNGERHAGTATVEEITQSGIAVRGLLLDLGMTETLLPGTNIWLHDSGQHLDEAMPLSSLQVKE
jgi:hypothetical protein